MIPTILSRIVERKKSELAAATRTRADLEDVARDRSPVRDFHAALAARKPAIIAEIKKASPSKGLLQPDFDPRRIARLYQAGGASALSVLTDADFQGTLADLESARLETSLPALRKDFTISEYHVVEAAAHGADAILLIAAILSAGELRGFRELAAWYGMAAIVETHGEAELEAALASGAKIVGVNNRNLHDFSVTLETCERLAPRIPAGVLAVAESGIHDASDVTRLMRCGYRAFLVGEHLMKSVDPVAALERLVSAPV